jgi:hypothetical protein
MATTEYTIYAYSPSTNQEVREFNLQTPQTNPGAQNHKYSQQIAEAFAYRLNQQSYLKANDWVGRVKQEQLGFDTIPNYLFNDPLQRF